MIEAPERVSDSALEDRFARLAAQWRNETGASSSLNAKFMHPAYQQIIGMGPAVLPLVFRELERQPEHWFWALYAITGANPVTPEQRGRLREMAQAWLKWGREEGNNYAIRTHR